MPEGLESNQQPAAGNAATIKSPNGEVFKVSIPDHHLIRCIGRGGYGEVWLGRNNMGTFRAIKIVHRQSFGNDRPYERELSGIKKFEPISRSHEGFVDVLHAGINEEQQYFYYVMELGDDQVSGQAIDPEKYSPRTLASRIGPRGKLPIPECFQLGLALCEALAQLHKHGLVHRDIKSENIIFVNGIPKLADIGLVADVAEARSYVGTEGFIPPEGPGSPQADVYSLGKVLYEACTGRDRQAFPELPTLTGPPADTAAFLELNEVIVKACDSDATRRYQSAREMYGDLMLLDRGKSVKRLRVLEKRLSLIKRVLTISAVVLAIPALVVFQAYRESRAVIRSQVGANVSYGMRALKSRDYLGALRFFGEASRLDDGNKERELEHRVRFGSVLAQCPRLVQMCFAATNVYTTGFTPDGQHILAFQMDGKLQVFDAKTGKPETKLFGHEKPGWRGGFSPDGTLVVTASEDKLAIVWRWADQFVVAKLNHDAEVLSAAFSPDGLRIVTGCANGVVQLWDAQSGAPGEKRTNHAGIVRYATFSHNGMMVLSSGEDGDACLWDLADGGTNILRGHSSWVMYAAFSPDDKKVVTASSDSQAQIWDTKTREKLGALMTHDDGINSAEFSMDGRFIVTAGTDSTVRFWSATTGLPGMPVSILQQADRITHAVFAPDGHRFATAGADGIVRVWDLAGGEVAPPSITNNFSTEGNRYIALTNGGAMVYETVSRASLSPLLKPTFAPGQAQLSDDGRYTLLRSDAPADTNQTSRVVQVVETSSGAAIGPAISITNPLSLFLLSRDGSRLLAFDQMQTQVWDVRRGRLLCYGPAKAGSKQFHTFSARGDKVATRSGTSVTVWFTDTGKELFKLERAVNVSSMAFSPDGSKLLTCDNGTGFKRSVAQIWSATTGKPLTQPMWHTDGLLFGTFSPDGKRVVTTGKDFFAITWDAATGKRLAAVRHTQHVTEAAFSPDGNWVVSAGRDRIAQTFNAETGDLITPPLRHWGMIDSAKFLADNREVIVRGTNAGAWIWKLTADERPIENMRQIVRLMSGDSFVPQPGLASDSSEPMAELWTRLHTEGSPDFSVTAEQVAAWHEFSARESEREKQWFALTFHLERLLALSPEDPLILSRLEQARAKLPE
jgi:WD40 repeat protein/serine/threonine protein kinase